MEQRPFRKIPFLYRMLATIFLVESGFLAFAFHEVQHPHPWAACAVGDRTLPKARGKSRDAVRCGCIDHPGTFEQC